MRHETCIACRYAASGEQLRALIAFTESLSPDTHHHHVMHCGSCNGWWFEDVVIGGLGIPVPARRDTVLCGCPEDDQPRYTASVITVPEPEADCHCTADLERQAVQIHTGTC